MRLFPKCPSIIHPRTPLLSIPFSSTPSYNNNNNHTHFISLLNNNNYKIALQIHTQLTTTGLLNKPTNTHFIFTFNTLLRHYSLCEFPQKALSLYKQALSLSSCFDGFTYSFLVKACVGLGDRVTGARLHGVVVKLGFGWGVYVQTALLNMYVGFGSVGCARKVFDEMPERNLVTWNGMVTGLVKWGYLDEALGLFWEMPGRNVVSWTGMINGCARMKRYCEAFSLFRKMIVVEGIMPTEVTVLTILPAVADLGDVENCQLIHGYGLKTGFNMGDVRVTNSLIDSYAKCGCIRSALRMFEEIPANRRKLVSWTSIISGFAMHGMATEAAEFFERMGSLGFKPNRVTLLSVLSACSHSGLVEEGLQFFRKMTDEWKLIPDIKHYGCVIDMLGRAGRLKEAEEMAMEIPEQIDNVIIWRTLLGACSLHGEPEMAERVTRKIHEIERGYGGDYVLMSNILTGHGRFSEAESVRLLMDSRKVTKIPANSSV